MQLSCRTITSGLYRCQWLHRALTQPCTDTMANELNQRLGLVVSSSCKSPLKNLLQVTRTLRFTERYNRCKASAVSHSRPKLKSRAVEWDRRL